MAGWVLKCDSRNQNWPDITIMSKRTYAVRAASDSLAQREAEKIAIKNVADSLGFLNLEIQKKFTIGEAWAIVDAFVQSENEIVLLEVNARVGTAMKTATKNKVLKDTLKMMMIERTYAAQWEGKRIRKILVFLDAIARESFGKKSWVDQAWSIFGVETYVCEIPDINRAALVEAQIAQDLRS